MARALRVEYPGARYHLMCRGNQGRDIFRNPADADLFVRCLGDMCARNEVRVHAWCLMSNHYHLLVETPAGNLVDAMKWFQGTFTQRYNAGHRLWGHLFQGRYKAKVVDDSDPAYFRLVGEYIHLNPADAGLVGAGRLADYPWSSYPLYLQPRARRPPWLETREVLRACGLPNDSAKSRAAYAAHMDLRHQSLLMAKSSGAKPAEWMGLERGWIHGSREFRARMLDCLSAQGPADLDRLADGEQKRDLSVAAADQIVAAGLKYFGLERAQLPGLPKSDPRKMLIAGLVRHHYPVSVVWVSQTLAMGHFTTVSRAMRFYDDARGRWATVKKAILKFIG